MAGDPISELCGAIRPIVRRQVQAAVGDREVHYDTDEIVRTILNHPDVVLRALGGTHDWHDDDQDVWWFPAKKEQG